MGEFLSVLKDSHTSISLDPWRKDILNGYNANSLQFTSIENLVYVKRDDLGQIKKGTLVKTISGISSEDLLSKAWLIAPQEGNSWTGKTRFAEALLVPVAVSLKDKHLGDKFQGNIQFRHFIFQKTIDFAVASPRAPSPSRIFTKGNSSTASALIFENAPIRIVDEQPCR